MKVILLICIVILAWMLWLSDQIIRQIRKHPRIITGGNPIGANATVRAVSGSEILLLKKSRKWLGKHVQAHHPRVYLKIKEIF